MSTDDRTPKLPEPICWTLTEQLQASETTCQGRIWFVSPGNSAWQPMFTSDQMREHAAAATLAERERTRQMLHAEFANARDMAAGNGGNPRYDYYADCIAMLLGNLED
jgi:hypothetical protein